MTFPRFVGSFRNYFISNEVLSLHIFILDIFMVMKFVELYTGIVCSFNGNISVFEASIRSSFHLIIRLNNNAVGLKKNALFSCVKMCYIFYALYIESVVMRLKKLIRFHCSRAFVI